MAEIDNNNNININNIDKNNIDNAVDNIKEEIKIEVKNLNFYYGDYHLLKDINLFFKKNSVCTILGPSGCGKSSFLRTLNRMNDYTEGSKLKGEVLLDGKNIYGKSIDVVELRRNVGMVFQNPNPFPKTIFENIAFGLKIHGIKNKQFIAERVEKCLKYAGLLDEVKDKLHKNAFSLSGGQQQRLCIARAIATNPSVLLMDEPTAYLDPASTATILDLIANFKKFYTIIIVSHNIQQAGRISDYSGFFLNGELIEFSKSGDFFTRPKDKRTENFITNRF